MSMEIFFCLSKEVLDFEHDPATRIGSRRPVPPLQILRLPAVGYFKGYSKALEYEYRVKTVALGTLKRYFILSLTLYLE
jgi:hypothetical protein